MSRDHFIIYDPVTGEEVMRGSGPAGSAEQQRHTARRALKVPSAVMLGALEDHVETLRAAMQERLSGRYARAGAGKPAARLRHALGVEADIDRAAAVADMLKIDIDAGWPE